MQALAEQSRIVRIPMNRVGSLNKINRTFSQLEQKYQREASNQEVADGLNIAIEDVDKALSTGSRHVSMNAPLVSGEDNSLLDVLENTEERPDSALIAESLQGQIERALGTLPEKERNVIVYYFGLRGNQPKSLEDIGDQFKLTRERVRQIKEQALRRLRKTSRSKSLKLFLG
jgi:RNA polymerase primary sigma factor